jgi:predicted acetyltransferase
MSKKDIADKFNVTLSKIEKELRAGIAIEKEHTGSATMAKEIAMDHLVEIPDYYTRLKKMEKEGEKKWSKPKAGDTLKEYFGRVLREQIDLNVTDETNESTSYTISHNERECGVLTLSNHNSTIPKGAIELVEIKIAEKYRGLKLGYEVVKQIWRTNPDINQIFLIPTTQSKLFWDKIGAKRLNDTYYVIYKGHS